MGITDEESEEEEPLKTTSRQRIQNLASREVGHERKGMFDPQSSRPAQALGPIESRLRDKLERLIIQS